MSRPDEIDFTFKKDDNLKDDTILDIDGKRSISYKDLSERFPIKKQEPTKCLIYWDDVCQYTSIGLIEIINSIYKSNAKIDLEHFFTRPNDYIYGIKYVYKLYEKVLTKEQIDEIKKKFYWKILEISLKSTVFNSITQTNTFFHKIGFYFPYRFENCESLREGLKNVFFKDRPYSDLQFFYGTEDKKSFNQVMKENGYNTVITPNVTNVYEYILSNNLKRITIIAPEDHNGITPDMYEVFNKYKGLPLPNYCNIQLYQEQVLAPND